MLSPSTERFPVGGLQRCAKGLRIPRGGEMAATVQPVAQLDPCLAGHPLAKLSRISTSDNVSAKSKMSAFSAIRSSFADLGMATIRCSMCQRRTTCAEVTL